MNAQLTATKTTTTAAPKARKPLYRLPKVAIAFVQSLTAETLGTERWYNPSPDTFYVDGYRGNGGKVYTVTAGTGTGRAQCAGCGETIKKGAACLLVGWEDSESYGYHLMKKFVHSGACGSAA